MKRVECIGMVGKFPTPNGMQTFYDTGRKVSAVDLAEAIVLQNCAFIHTGKERKESIKQACDFVIRIAKTVNVYPIGFAGLASDGRILVTEPWFETKEA